MREIAADGPWAARLASAPRAAVIRHSADWYYRLLREGGAAWISGRPPISIRSRAGPPPSWNGSRAAGCAPISRRSMRRSVAEFLARYEAAVAKAYPALPDGTVLLPFRGSSSSPRAEATAGAAGINRRHHRHRAGRPAHPRPASRRAICLRRLWCATSSGTGSAKGPAAAGAGSETGTGASAALTLGAALVTPAGAAGIGNSRRPKPVRSSVPLPRTSTQDRSNRRAGLRQWQANHRSIREAWDASSARGPIRASYAWQSAWLFPAKHLARTYVAPRRSNAARAAAIDVDDLAGDVARPSEQRKATIPATSSECRGGQAAVRWRGLVSNRPLIPAYARPRPAEFATAACRWARDSRR